MSLGDACPPMVCERQKKNRSRPNLSKVCQKTKLCSFHFNGNCERAEACSFAHDPSELKPKPDLQRTKLCPHLLKKGHCAKRSSCKFAHDECEVQAIDLENMVPPSPDTQSAIGHQVFLPPLPFSLEQALEQANPVGSCGSLRTSFFTTPTSSPRLMYPRPTSYQENSIPTTPENSPRCVDPCVTSYLGNAAESGALLLQEMVLHLTRIFTAVYEAQPDVAERTGVPASLLATATAEQAWSDAGFHRDARMSFMELMHWCAFPMLLEMRTMSQKVDSLDDHWTPGPDSDAWSQVSTDEGTVGSQSPDGTASLHSFCEDASDARAWTTHGTADVEITIRSTFYHFEIPSVVTTLRRSRSVPSHPRSRGL